MVNKALHKDLCSFHNESYLMSSHSYLPSRSYFSSTFYILISQSQLISHSTSRSHTRNSFLRLQSILLSHSNSFIFVTIYLLQTWGSGNSMDIPSLKNGRLCFPVSSLLGDTV